MRRLYALVKNLPPEAALWRAMPDENPEPQVSGGRNVIDMRKNIDPNVIAGFFKQKVNA